MKDNFLERIKNDFIIEIKEMIDKTKLSAEKSKLNAIDTLILMNNIIDTWILSISGSFRVDEELLNEVAKLKKPFIDSAKKEIAVEVAKIVETESTDVTLKINEYMNRLKKKGIDIDGNNKKTEKKLTNSFESQSATRSHMDNIVSNSSVETNTDSKRHVLKKEPGREKRSQQATRCYDTPCGSSSGGCCS